MASQRFNRFEIRQMQYMPAVMTEQNHLALAGMTKPYEMKGVIDRLFSSTLYSDNPLTQSLMIMPHGTETIDTTEWTWYLQGGSQRPSLVVEDIEPNGLRGQHGAAFSVLLDTDGYVVGDTLMCAAVDSRFQGRIATQGVPFGRGYKYTMYLVGMDKSVGVPEVAFQPGAQWIKLYSTYGEGAEQGGSTFISTPMQYQNSMGIMRKMYRVTDYASQEVLATKIPDPSGKEHDTWIKLVDATTMQQWYRERERALWYNRASDGNVLDTTGRPVRTFPGVLEQLEGSNVHYYSHLSGRLIEEFLMDIFFGRVEPGKKRNIKAFTGEYGMLAFSKAMEALVYDKDRGIVLTESSLMRKASSPYHDNAYSVGQMFVKYEMPNGCTLELVHNPLFDDREMHKVVDPYTGYPAESMRFVFFDFGEGANGSNVKIMQKKNGYNMAYVCGLYGPTGPNKNPSHSGSYYEMHMTETFGLHINDVSKCGMLVLGRQ